MPYRRSRLLLALLLLDAVILSLSTPSAEQSSSITDVSPESQSLDKEDAYTTSSIGYTSFPPNSWSSTPVDVSRENENELSPNSDESSNENGISEGNSTDEGNTFNEGDGPMETEAMYRYDYERYDRYNQYDRYNRYDSYNQYDRYNRNDRYDRYERYNSYDRYDQYDRYGNSRRPYYRYDRYDDYGNRRWNEPKRWRDFSYRRYYGPSYGGDQPWPRQENRWDRPQDDEWNFEPACNKINRNDTPDQPYGYSDQAYEIPIWKAFKSQDINVSAYDVYKERCCQGKTYPKYPNGRYACCGSSDYDSTREVCCDGKSYPLQPAYECCAEKYINTDTEICCYHPTNGIVAKPLPVSNQKQKETRLFSQCCGDELYDTQSHVCFLVTSRYNDVANFTVIERNYNRTGCCEGKPYDQDAEICNETGRVYTFLSGPPCVFKQAYEKAQKQFSFVNAARDYSYYRGEYEIRLNYRGEYEIRHNYLSHCGPKKYDYSFQICCGDVYNQENGTVKIWNRIPYSSCCGTEIFNYDTHRCCNDRIVEKRRNYYGRQECCGQQLYDSTKEWCCAGSNTIIEPKRDQGDRCCGKEGLAFNSSTHICCSNNVIQLPERRYPQSGYGSGPWKCCPSNDPTQPDQVYLYYYSKCCSGVVYNISRDFWRYECCGSEIYDRDSSVCCNGKVYNQKSCCANKEAYNSSTHKCCDGTVAEKLSTYADSCCGKTTYDYQLQTCCVNEETNVWQATSKKSRREGCCGGKPYDADKHYCCGLSVIFDPSVSHCCHRFDPETRNVTYAAIEKKANAKYSSCCGLTAFDARNEICCRGNVFSDVHKNMTCCGSNAYNRGSQLCCSGEVHDKSDDGNKVCCGMNAYDMTKEICCRGVVLPVNDVNSAMCCYEKP